MKCFQMIILVIICIFIVGLSCSSEPTPDHYGIFIVSKGRLIELQRISWEKLGKSYSPELGDLLTFSEKNIVDIDNPNVYFIIYGMGEEPIILPAVFNRRECYVRYPTPAKLTGGVKRYPAIEEFEIMPIEGKKEMYRVKQKVRLTSGIYLFSTVGCRDNLRDFRCFFPLRIR